MQADNILHYYKKLHEHINLEEDGNYMLFSNIMMEISQYQDERKEASTMQIDDLKTLGDNMNCQNDPKLFLHNLI